MTDKTVTKWAQAPSCPKCGTNVEVERLPKPIHDKHLFCAVCALVFDGSDREWRTYRTTRERTNA